MPINMLPQILLYFRAEKQWSLYILIVAAVAILFGAVLWWSGSRFRGAAIPLTAIAIIQLTAGGTIYMRTDAQIDTLTEQYYTDREAYAVAETARMEEVMSGFRFYEIMEIALIIGGLAMMVLLRKRPAYVGAGAGLILQAAIMLAFDLIASQRAQVYLDALRRA